MQAENAPAATCGEGLDAADSDGRKQLVDKSWDAMHRVLCGGWLDFEHGDERRRAGRGLCPRCGYELRARPGRCPECGMAGGLAGGR